MARKHSSPHPKRGTPHGDAVVGNCARDGCGRELARADSFVVRIDGKLFCTEHRDPANSVKKVEA